MFNPPSSEVLSQFPKLYETENIPITEKIVHAHFFLSGSDWYLIETDGDDLCFGFAILNNDLRNSEFGYFSLNELKSLKIGFLEVDRDLHWEPQSISNVRRIQEARA